MRTGLIVLVMVLMALPAFAQGRKGGHRAAQQPGQTEEQKR